MQIIPDSSDLPELGNDESDDEEQYTHSGTIEGIGKTMIYKSCPYPPCNSKKLTEEGVCPTCTQQIPSDRQKQSVTSTFSVKIDDELVTYRVFNKTINSMFMYINEELPASADDIEDVILDNLPLKCRFTVGYGTNSNIISTIVFHK